MKLNIIVDGRANAFEVPDNLLTDAVDFFEKLDADMDRGWQMSRDWVDSPDPEQRCQIAADKILTAIETENEKLLMTARYKRRLIQAFEAMITKRRETHDADVEQTRITPLNVHTQRHERRYQTKIENGERQRPGLPKTNEQQEGRHQRERKHCA